MTAPKIHALALITALGIGAADLPAAAGDPHAAAPAQAPTAAARPDLADHALRMLQEGNQRFIDGKSNHPNTDVFRIADTGGNGQHPFAAIVTCADSRLAVERLFDRGVGDLFVVRVAGNICDANEAGSVEYACEHLGSQLVVFMGHSRCGAVKAAIAGGDAGRNVNSLLDNIAPAVQAVKAAHPALVGDELVDAVVRENVWRSMQDLFESSEPMRSMVAGGRVKVVGAVYDVQSGRVEWLGQHPMQTVLLKAPTAAESATAEPERAVVEPPKPEPKPEPRASAESKSGFVKPQTTARKEAEKKPEPAKPAHSEPAHAAHPH